MATNVIWREITQAPHAYRLLRGCLCLYKPPRKGFNRLQMALRQKIVKELNEMECRPPRERIEITGELLATQIGTNHHHHQQQQQQRLLADASGHDQSITIPVIRQTMMEENNNDDGDHQQQQQQYQMETFEEEEEEEEISSSSSASSSLQVILKPNLADHPLVSGQRYTESQIALKLLNNPGWYASGIVLALIGRDCRTLLRDFNRWHWPKIYEIKGKLGIATQNFRDDGKFFCKSTYKHVKREYMERVIAKIESSHRTRMFKLAGVDLRSSDAYKLACNGPITMMVNNNQNNAANAATPGTRNRSAPIIYSARLTHFDSPHFTIQLQCINENEMFLAELINEIGLSVHSTATCTGISLRQYGVFNVNDHALLDKHWTLENLLTNVYENRLVLEKIKENEEEGFERRRRRRR